MVKYPCRKYRDWELNMINLKKYLNKRDLLFAFLFLLIGISTCKSIQEWTREAEKTEISTENHLPSE